MNAKKMPCDVRGRCALVPELQSKVILPLKCQRLLVPEFRSGREHERVDRARLTAIASSFGAVRCLNVVWGDIGYSDVLRLELTAETRSLKRGTKDSGFVGVDIEGNFRPI